MTKAAAVALLVALTMAGCGDDAQQPARDRALWEQAKDIAGTYCAVVTQTSSLYSDEYRNCVDERTPIEYRTLIESR